MGIRIDKNFLRVKSVPIPRFTGTIHSIPIAHTWLNVGYKYMPDIEATISIRVEIDYPDGIGIIWFFEYEKLNSSCIGTEKRKVCSFFSWRTSEWM